MERTTVIKTYSIDEQIAEKFKEQTPKQQTSQKLEELMAEYIDEDVENRKEPIKILDRNVVSKKRCKVVRLIVKKDWFNKTGPQVFKKLKSKGVYQGDSASHHFKNALKFLEKYEQAPIIRKKNKIVPEQFLCKNEGCEAGLNLKSLSKNSFKCPRCDRRYKI